MLTREELLNYAKLTEILKATPQEEIIPVIADLKQQAKDQGLSIRDFNAQVKLVQEDLNKPVKHETDTTNLPEYIINFGEYYYLDGERIMTQFGRLEIEVCSHLIFPAEILTDINTGEEKVRLSFKRYGKWQDLIVPRYDIATAKNIIKLSNQGIMVNDENARYLIKFLADIETKNELTISHNFTTSKLGYTDYGFVPFIDNVVYSGSSPTNERVFSLMQEHGDQSKWLEAQKQILKYKIPKIMIASAYASLLTNTFEFNPFVVHLWGDTGKGKSMAVLSAASIYGYPDIKNGIVRTGNTTANGIEPIMDFYNNCTVYFDELSTMSQDAIEKLIYAATQGQGKGRMTRTGKGAKTYTWNNIAVFNAEFPIINNKTKGGAANRIISIHATGNIFGDTNLPELASTFKNNYGFGIKKFVKLLEDKTIQNQAIELRNIYYSKLIDYTEDKQANSMAILLTAYELARVYIYESKDKLTVEDVKEWIQSKDDINQSMRAYNSFLDFVDANYKYFDDSDTNYSKWGFIKEVNGKTRINVFRAVLTEFCDKNNINETQLLSTLRERELLISTFNSFTNKVRWGKQTKTMVTIIKEQDPFDNMIPIEDNTGDLPF